MSLSRSLHVVAIGGGTGLSTLLKGLKRYVPVAGQPTPATPIEITAVVTVSDDGGSSGRLRREMDVLPPGDIRNCLVALSEDEALLSRLFQHRFAAGRGLKGHNFGNLFLTALTQVTGDFGHAIALSSEILASRGRIFPATSDNVVLEAQLADGSVIVGESRIGKTRKRIRRISLQPCECMPLPETLQAIAQADLICLGPGSLYTSIVPNLLVKGIAAAIESSTAPKAYFCNLMTQPGETLDHTAVDHVQAIQEHAQRRLLDYVVVSSSPIAPPQRQRYAAERAQPVEVDEPALRALGVDIVAADLLAEGDKVRHDPDLTAAVAVQLAQAARRSRAQARPTLVGV